MNNVRALIAIGDIQRARGIQDRLGLEFEKLDMGFDWTLSLDSIDATGRIMQIEKPFDLVVTDLTFKMPAAPKLREAAGIEIIEEARKRSSRTFILLIAYQERPGLFDEATKLGANHVVRIDQFSVDSKRNSPAIIAGEIRNYLLTEGGSSTSKGGLGQSAEALAQPTESAVIIPQRDHVEWLSDTPTSEDLLGRKALAKALATRLQRFHDDEPGTSFLVHVDGPWGTGKSSLLFLLQAELEEQSKWLTIDFNAWRQSRMGTPWWALLAALRHDLARSYRLPGRVWLRFSESWARFRRTGAPFAFAFIVLLMIAFAVFVLLRPHELTFKSSNDLAQATVAGLTALGTLWAGALVAGRFLLWDSARGARLFEQSNANPMQSVVDHFSWLLTKAKRPVVFLIDDLDRCADTYVVELLDNVQTLIRDAGKAPAGGSTKTIAAAAFVVAADGAWIRRSYEIAYAEFASSLAEPGRPLGYLFLDKLFQLRAPVPAIDAARQQDYLACLLRFRKQSEATRPRTAEERAVREDLRQSTSEAEIVETLRNASPEIRGRVTAAAVEKLTTPAVAADTEHRLQRFSPLLSTNPRAIKRFINDYSILRYVRTLEGNTVDMDPLALWAILETRWPALADYLRIRPEKIQLLEGADTSLKVLKVVPTSLRNLFYDVSVREVATFRHGGPLTPELIRTCSGIVPPADAAQNGARREGESLQLNLGEDPSSHSD